MFVTYPVHTYSLAEAIKIATNLARASGYKRVTFTKAVETGSSSWDIVLVVS